MLMCNVWIVALSRWEETGKKKKKKTEQEKEEEGVTCCCLSHDVLIASYIGKYSQKKQVKWNLFDISNYWHVFIPR